MAFSKGVSGNPNGRPKGAGNKVTSEVKQVLEEILLDPANTERLKNAFLHLQPRDFVRAYESLLPYILPKMNHNALTIDQLTDEQVEHLYEQVINTVHQQL